MSVCTSASHLRKSGHSGCCLHSLHRVGTVASCTTHYRTNPSHLPPSTPRQLHMRRPHPPIDTVPPPRHTPSTRPTGPTLLSPQEPPFHTDRHHTTSQQAHPPGALREGDTKANSSTYMTYKGKPTATVPRKSVRRQKQYCHSHIPSPLPPPTAARGARAPLVRQAAARQPHDAVCGGRAARRACRNVGAYGVDGNGRTSGRTRSWRTAGARVGSRARCFPSLPAAAA